MNLSARISAWVKCVFVAACLLGLGKAVLAADKSGVTPNTISLPKGPGSIEGLGESFQPTLNTGTAKYQVALKVPPGTAGHAPSLALHYDGGGSNGPLGFGWSLGIRLVQRQTDKGIPRYVDADNNTDDDGDGLTDEPDEIDTFINELKEELVLTSSGFYFCENEGPFIRYRRVRDESHDHWEGTLPDGTLMEFGLTSDGRISDATTGHVFRWLLEKQTDTNGNTIVYTYKSFPGDENTNQRYLSRIEYGPGGSPWNNFHFVVFEYEDRSDWFEDCRSGFIIRTGKRMKEIIIGTQGPTLTYHSSGDFNHDGIVDYLNRTYLLTYEAHPHWSVLTSVAWIGADGFSTYPPLTLGYTISDPPDTISASGKIIGSFNTPFQVMDNDLVDLVDLNGDGLPDILKTDEYGGPHTVYLNLGETVQNSNKVIHWAAATEVSSADGLAWNVNLGNKTNAIAHMADMDADGLADLVYKSIVGDVYYFRNQANQSWGARLRMNNDPSASAPPSPFGVDNVKTADLDFNKHMDIIQSIDDGYRYKVWFNLGNQTYSRLYTVSQDFGFMFSWSGVHIADFNGDRVPDIIRVRPTGLQVTAGLGYGKFAPMVFVPLFDYTLDDSGQSSQVAKARMQDISGDGLVDLVIERAIPGQLWYWINLGNYCLDQRRIITGMPTGLGTNTEIRWADLNGNSTTDLIYADKQMDPKIQTVDIGELIGCAPSPNMLLSIDNGIGRKTSIEYATSTQFLLKDQTEGHNWSYPLPFPVNVVSKVIVDDSMDNLYVTEYTYHDGYYDGKEKEFRGFVRAETREIGDITAPDLIMEFIFHVGEENEALKGKMLQLEARNTQDEVFYTEVYTWDTKKLHDSTTDNGKKITYPFQQAKVRNVLEKGNGEPVQIMWKYEYDDYGNLIKQIELGRMDPGWDDERITVTSYMSEYPDGQSNWILRRVVEQQIEDENAEMIANSRNYYDGYDLLGQVSRGNLTRSEDWVSSENYVVSVRNDYDVYGNIIAIYDPLYGTQPGHYRTLFYENFFHTFPEQEIIDTGKMNPSVLTFSATYDYGFGVVTSSSDFNGNTTTYGYDAFSRLAFITRPLDTGHTEEYDYALAHDLGDGRVVNWIETRQRDGSAGDGFLHSRTFYDGLSRKLMTRTEGEEPELIVVTDVIHFNAKRQPWKQYLPYFGTGTLEFTKPALDIGFTEYYYDALGRVIRINQPRVAQNVVYAATWYAPLMRTVRDEEQTDPNSAHYGSCRTYVEDGLLNQDGNGRLRERIDIVKLSDTGESLEVPVEWKNSFYYDIIDNLTEYRDAQGNTRVFNYDGLSRKIYMNDPDRGELAYKYDDASNVIETIDAKGQRIVYTYDGINRLISEDYIDDGLTHSIDRSPDVVFWYDIPVGLLDLGDNTQGQAANTNGKLSRVDDLYGSKHISYDERGRMAWVVNRFIDSATGLAISYKTESTYDSMNRLTTVIYPDNDRVTYTYNRRGTLAEVGGGNERPLISNIEYNPSGRIIGYDLSNGISLNKTYDLRQRLHQIDVFSKADPTYFFLSYEYIYDGVSNILRVNDMRSGSIIPPNDSRRDTQIFTYDDLYQLTSVSYSFAVPGQPDGQDGSIGYKYDRIGNMFSKTSEILHFKNGFSVTNVGQMNYGGTAGRFNRAGHLPGDPPGPHALTSTNNGSEQHTLAYDDNGNVTQMDGNTFTWDFKDRLVAVENERILAEYIYDYSGHRTIKRVRPKTKTASGDTTSSDDTTYIDQYYEIRNEQPIKYVYAGDKRIARVTGTLDPDANRVQRVILHTGWNLIAVAVDSDIRPIEKSSILEAFKWNKSVKGWERFPLSRPLVQGDVLWLLTKQPVLVTLVGTYSEPEAPSGLENNTYFGNCGLSHMPLETPPAGASVWFYDSSLGKWRAWFGDEESFLSDTPHGIAAGQVIFVRAEESTQVKFSKQSASFLYYHKNHLGSSSITTDSMGDIHSEQYYYPYGESRIEKIEAGLNHYYSFIDKEQDEESGNYYLGSRYYNGTICRFLSVEPLIKEPDTTLDEPITTQIYAYSRNNPIIYFDRDGFEAQKKQGLLDRIYDFLFVSKHEQRMNEFRSDIKNNHTNYNKYGGMYGRIQNNEEIGKWAAGAYASTKGALPLLHITAEIAVLPFGGVESAGKLGIRLILKAGAKAGGKTLFKESVKTGIQKLAGQEVDLSKRGKEIAIDVAASALIGSAGIVKDKFIGDLTNKLMKFESEESKAIFQKFLGDLIDKTRASLSDKAVKDLKQAATTED